MGIALIDTNIFIDHLAGVEEAMNEIAYYDNIAISAITWSEVAVLLDANQLVQFDALIRDLSIYVIHTDDAIIREATRARAESFARNAVISRPKVKKLKTPDAIILATAHVTGRILVSRDADDFIGVARVPVRLPYKYASGIVSDVAPSP
jgi:predicted nucleic acid-binding protein